VTSFVESGGPLRWPGLEQPEESLGWSELELLREAGWEVGSHTVTHPLLPDLDDAELERELVDSSATIRRRLGSCETLAYPYGRADERTSAAAARAGYLAAFTLGRAHRPDEPLRRPRLGLRDVDRGVRLGLRLSTGAALARRSRPVATASALHRAMLPRPAWLPVTSRAR
jgi:peptidoglycan/xylan/chitin deacetylase (PgdA/CDA1 family)